MRVPSKHQWANRSTAWGEKEKPASAGKEIKNALFLFATIAGITTLISKGCECTMAEGNDNQCPVLKDSVDYMTYENLYDGAGNAVLDQLILWDWNAREEKYEVRAWRLVPTEAKEVYKEIEGKRRSFRECLDNGAMRPVKEGRIWKSHFTDKGMLREISAKAYEEKWMQIDTELEDRHFLPREQRRGLNKRP